MVVGMGVFKMGQAVERERVDSVGRASDEQPIIRFVHVSDGL